MFINNVICCEEPPPNLNSTNLFYTQFGPKPPNLQTADISGYTVVQFSTCLSNDPGIASFLGPTRNDRKGNTCKFPEFYVESAVFQVTVSMCDGTHSARCIRYIVYAKLPCNNHLWNPTRSILPQICNDTCGSTNTRTWTNVVSFEYYALCIHTEFTTAPMLHNIFDSTECFSNVGYWTFEWGNSPFIQALTSTFINHAKLAPGWALIRVNFDPIQEMGQT